MNAPLNYFLHSAGPATRPTMILGWVFTAILTLVCILIVVLLFIAVFRRRPTQDHRKISRGLNELRWVYAGTGISVLILFGMMIYALITLNEVATPPATPALITTVTGYDWWWKVEYDDPDPARRIITANEIHIPVGKPVLIKLQTADVIHAFWVPELAGKTQMIPGMTNQQWLEADKPGVYRGICNQFCGIQHAHMGFQVIAESEADFERWKTAQRMPAAVVSGAVQKNGQKIFMERCAACHSVKGTEAAGDHGPDLTHLNMRRLIAAGLLTNTTQHVMDWVEHAQEMKSGARMPDFMLSHEEADALSLYLSTLK